jgi:hypothetical protein
MTCLEIKDFLQENFVAAGFDLTPEIKQHFDDCEGCRSYYAEMVSLGDALEPMTDIAMTPEESVHFDIGLHLAIEKFASSQPSYVSEGRIFSIARMALAAADCPYGIGGSCGSHNDGRFV